MNKEARKLKHKYPLSIFGAFNCKVIYLLRRLFIYDLGSFSPPYSEAQLLHIQLVCNIAALIFQTFNHVSVSCLCQINVAESELPVHWTECIYTFDILIYNCSKVSAQLVLSRECLISLMPERIMGRSECDASRVCRRGDKSRHADTHRPSSPRRSQEQSFIQH